MPIVLLTHIIFVSLICHGCHPLWEVHMQFLMNSTELFNLDQLSQHKEFRSAAPQFSSTHRGEATHLGLGEQGVD